MSRDWSTALAVLAVSWGPSALPAAAPPPATPLPRLSSGEAWELLPRREPLLPVWVRALAGPLPRTTAGMLELDRLHRADNPLGPALAGRLRWAAADAIGSDYARRYAEADLRRAGAWGGDQTKADPAAIAFARKLTRAGHEVTDAELAQLIEQYGAEKVVAMVHTVALANFQNRVFLALGAAVEPGGPLPPIDVVFDLSKDPKVPAAPRPTWPSLAKGGGEGNGLPGWAARPYDELEKSLARQKARRSRIPTPGPERMAKVPPESKAQASRVVWTAVSMGYQPRLTRAWFDTMRAFQLEAKLDPVFSNTLFWVVTRGNECFY